MADNATIFALETVAGGWFAPEVQGHGWFDRDQLDPPSGSTNATANGVTLTETYSFLPGTASSGGGAIDGTASGVTLTEAYSLIAGSASGQSNATASGVILTETYSLLAGTATGQSNATANGATVSEVYSFQAGTASGQSNATASGVVVSENYSFQAGAASGGTAATANGVTVSYVYSFIAGLASGEVYQQPQFIGDGVYRGHERAAQERIESRDKLKAIVARAYDKVVGVKPSVASPQEVPKATKSQKRNIASRVFTEIKTEGLLDALENIGDLIAQYEQSQRQAKQMYDDDLMMVMMLA